MNLRINAPPLTLTLSPRRGEGIRWIAMLGRIDQGHGPNASENSKKGSPSTLLRVAGLVR